MALLERVSTLLRANLNDLLDRAEDPEKLSKQILSDLENQLLQVKTQVAIAIAEAHRLARLRTENETGAADWRRKAGVAVDKGQDDLARAALERSLSHMRMAEGYAAQHADQLQEADALRGAYAKLGTKLNETRARVELLIAQHRRNRAAAKANPVRTAIAADQASDKLARLNAKVTQAGDDAAISRTVSQLLDQGTLEDRFRNLEQEDQIEALLLELKGNQPRLDR